VCRKEQVSPLLQPPEELKNLQGSVRRRGFVPGFGFVAADGAFSLSPSELVVSDGVSCRLDSQSQRRMRLIRKSHLHYSLSTLLSVWAASLGKELARFRCCQRRPRGGVTHS
jgi:hypothetical protein